MKSLKSAYGAVSKVVKPAMPWLCVAVLAVGVMSGVAIAQDGGVTLPDVGVDVADHVDAAGEELGTIVLQVVGVAFIFLVIAMGIRWARKGG